MFVYNALNQIIEKKLNVRLKIFYFTLEMSKEEKMLYLISNILYIKEGLRIPPVDLKSTSSQRILSQEVLDIIKKYQEYIEKIESIIEFVDSVSNPTGIFKIVRDYAHAHGTQHRRVIKTGDGREIEVDDYYEPNDPDEYVMVIIDHISLISTESNLDLRESITKLSSSYLIQLRNKYNYIPVIIQQQAAAQESVENKKANKLKPSLDGLGDNKLTQRDANVILGLFSPLRHELPEYMGYDITFFKDNIRFLEVLGGREGGAGIVTPLYFDGAVNFFKELPKPQEDERINEIYKHITKNIR